MHAVRSVTSAHTLENIMTGDGPMGLFIYQDKRQQVYVAIDNRTGQPHVQHFENKHDAMMWLKMPFSDVVE